MTGRHLIPLVVLVLVVAGCGSNAAESDRAVDTGNDAKGTVASPATSKHTLTIVMLRSLAKASGQGSVTVSTTTRGLHGEVLLTRRGGSGTARGQATVSCETRGAQGSSGTDQRFTFEIKPGGQQEVWQHSGGGTCTVSVIVNGKGLLSVALRGY